MRMEEVAEATWEQCVSKAFAMAPESYITF